MNSCLWFVSLICALVAIAACGPEAPGTAPASGTSDLPPEIAVRTTGLLTAGRNPGARTAPRCQLLRSKGSNVPSKG